MTDHIRAAALLDRHAARTAGADGDSLAAAVERHRRQVAQDRRERLTNPAPTWKTINGTINDPRKVTPHAD